MVALGKPLLSSDNSVLTGLPFDNQIPHILIVDDQEINREVLYGVLVAEYQVTEAQNGLEALELILHHRFDLILLDVMMPHMDGLETLRKIRQTKSSTDLPVILVSGLQGQQHIVDGLEAGANDYLLKPFDMAVVQARVKAQLQIKSAFDVQKQSLAELRKTNVLKSKLLGIASHDLKSPLSNIFMAESLLRHLVDLSDPTMLAILNTMKSTLNMMNDTILEFLDIAAIQNEMIAINIEPIEIRTVIDTVIEQYELQSQEKGSLISPLNCDGVVLADQNHLKHILGNLVSNALKYSPPNSEIKVNVIQRESHHVIQVIDQGPGIPEDEQDLLFTEFGKLSTRPTGDESSTGLGLWIVKQMTELMNGQIGFECPDTGGSIFWVELPASKPDAD